MQTPCSMFMPTYWLMFNPFGNIKMVMVVVNGIVCGVGIGTGDADAIGEPKT